jgi:membrane-associated phospholipid phosphatase
MSHRRGALLVAFLVASFINVRLVKADAVTVLNPYPLPPASVGSPFTTRLAADLAITLGAGAIALTSEIMKGELPGPSCGLVCDPQNINALDRTVVGKHSAAARTASDILLYSGIGLPFALDLIDVLANHPPDGFRGYGQDVLVLAEVFTVNSGLNALVKFAVRRPRPLVYDPDLDAVSAEQRSATDAALSFYSGHTSTTFSMATAYSYLFMQRHPHSKLIVPVWLIAEGLAATTAVMRVEAGKHFWTDVITGAVVGSAVGLLIPYLHRKALPVGVPAFASQLHFSATPMIAADRAGLILTIE